MLACVFLLLLLFLPLVVLGQDSQPARCEEQLNALRAELELQRRLEDEVLWPRWKQDLRLMLLMREQLKPQPKREEPETDAKDN